METKCIVLGETEQPKKGKPIEFIHAYTGKKNELDGTIAETLPKNWRNIELTQKAINEDFFDMMFAYDDDRTCGCTYAGHWNDGFVE